MIDLRPIRSGTRRVRGIIAACLVLCACSVARPDVVPAAGLAAGAAAVRSVALTVRDLDEAERFFTDALGFRVEEAGAALSGEQLPAARGLNARRTRLRAGDEVIELVQYEGAAGRPTPADSRSDDGWFQHLALVTRDIDALEAKVLRSGASAISHGTQTIPRSNAAAGGIRAFYFRGPAGHPLELIWYPAGRGAPRWQSGGAPVLGIDHTAIAVADTERSRSFYEDLLGLRVAGRSFNFGEEQAALSGVDGARVRITGLRGSAGPGVELLEYEAPRTGRPMPADTRPNDAWYAEITVAVPDLDTTVAQLRAAHAVFVSDRAYDTSALVPGTHRGVLVRDPDGHAIRLVQ